MDGASPTSSGPPMAADWPSAPSAAPGGRTAPATNVPSRGLIWLFDQAGGEPVLLHSLRAPPSAYIEESDVMNPPM